MGVYIYMLRCADGSYYVGNATGEDIAPRVDQHNAGSYKGYTFTMRPVVLVWFEYFERITDGIAVERQLKGWSRAKKEALIRSDWTKVSELSRRRGGVGKAALAEQFILRGAQERAPQDDVCGLRLFTSTSRSA